MLAHSMGNIVAGEALRLAGNDQLVNTYVASQAALPAHDYDSTVTSPYLLQFTYTYPSGPLSYLGSHNYGPNAPNIYGGWLTSNVAAVSRRINFYNQNDFALALPRWGFDQITKPDQSAFGWTYAFNGYPHAGVQSYTPGPDDIPPWNYFFKFSVFSSVDFDIVNVLTNRYEVMAYAAPARSTALGATPITTFESVNLASTINPIWPPDSTGNNYTEHFWHSAEFRGDCWQEWGYWQTLLYSSQNGFNISNP